MNVSQLAEALRTTFRYNLTTKRHEDKITPMIWGPPGVGKSDIVYQVAEQLGYRVVELRLNSVNPVDVRGFPYLDEDTKKGQFAKPYYFPNPDEDPRVIIFLDEVNTALPTNQVTAYELCQNYAVGGMKLPQEVLIVAAGNREDDGGVTFEMPTPLANRMQHLYVLPSKTAFVQYGVEKGILEDIIGFIQFKPALLHSMGTDKAFPTPRTWEKLSSISKFNGRIDPDIATSLVGPGAAGELMAYISVKSKIPDVDKALDECIPFQSPEGSVMFSFLTSVVYRLNENPTAARFKNFVKLMEVLPFELQVVSVHMISKKVRKLAMEEAEDEFWQFIEKFDK